ncbi:DUF4855 domain-containing protein [Sporosarcina sp. ITBMC105]
MKILKSLFVLLLGSCLFVNSVGAQSFRDVPRDHWAKDEIRFLTDKRVIKGFSDGSFQPMKVLTRKDASVMLVRALQLPAEKQPSVKPSDLKSTMGGYAEMMVVANRGMLTIEGGRFHPDRPLTRGEMAKALAVAYKYKGAGKSIFKDVSKSNAYYTYIDAIAENKITTGYVDGSFKPTVAVNRAQFSTFLKRVYDQPHAFTVKKAGKVVKTFTSSDEAIRYAVGIENATVHPVSNSLMRYEQKPADLKTATSMKNGVLIYSGAEKENFAPEFFNPYFNNGKSNLFDTFVVLGRMYPGGEFQETSKNQANYKEWNWFADKLFSKQGPLHALNEAARSANQKANVYIAIPYPKRNGAIVDLNGKKVSNTLAARQQLVNWYMTKVEKQWQQAGYKHLSFTGYYWLNETVIHAEDEQLVTDTATAIHKKKKKFIYAPHARTTNFEKWKLYGFDGAYLQPNTFRLNLGDPKARLHKAFLEAQIKGSSITLEIDTYSPHQMDAGLKNFETYLAFAELYGLKGQSLLLYQGVDMVYRMNHYKQEPYKKAYDQLSALLEK